MTPENDLGVYVGHQFWFVEKGITSDVNGVILFPHGDIMCVSKVLKLFHYKISYMMVMYTKKMVIF